MLHPLSPKALWPASYLTSTNSYFYADLSEALKIVTMILKLVDDIQKHVLSHMADI